MNTSRALRALPVLLVLLPLVGAVAAQAPSAAEKAKAKEAEAQFKIAVTAMTAKQYDTALKGFEHVVNLFPKAAPAWVNIGVIYRIKNDPARAEAALKKAVALMPRDAMALRALSDTYVSQKRWADAAPLLRRAVAVSPNDPLARAALGDTELALGNKAAAVSQFRAAVRLKPDFVPVHRALAMIYGSQNQTSDLKRELIAIQKATPNDPQVAFNLGLAYARTNNPREALVQFQKVVALQPTNTVAQANVARMQLQLGETEKAVALFSRIIKKNPKDPEANFALGVAAYNKKRYAEAEKRFRTVLAGPASGRELAAKMNLGGSLLFQNKGKEAAAIYEQVLRADPKNKQAYSMLAYAYQRAGQNEKANAAYKRLLEVDPNDAAALQSVAMATQFSGKPGAQEEAIPYYERLLKVRPNDQLALNMLSNLYTGQKQTDKAIALYKPLLAKDKSKHAEIANLYSQSGQPDKAIQELTTWTKEQPKNIEAWLALGDQYSTQGKTVESRKAFDEAKTAQPDSVEPYIRYAQLMQRQAKPEDALKELATVPKTVKSVDRAYQMAGGILEGQKKTDEAIAQYRLAANANPKLTSYRQSIASLLLDSGKTDESIKEYQGLATKSPKDPTIQSGLAKALEKKGDTAGAIAAYRKAGSLNKFDTTWVTSVARLQDASGHAPEAMQTLLDNYIKAPGDRSISDQLLPLGERLGKLDTIIAAYSKLASSGPNNPPLYTQLADAYSRKDAKSAPSGLPGPQSVASGRDALRDLMTRFPKNEGIARAFATYAAGRGRWQDVVAADRILVALSPDNTYARIQLADALVSANDKDGAEKEYKKVLEKDAPNLSAHLGLAKLYESQNRVLDARNEYEAVQRTDFNNAEAKSALERLKAPVGAAPATPTPVTNATPPTPVGLTPPLGR